MVKVSISYDGQLHCTARHLPSGHAICTDAPIDNQGRGEAFSPTDLMAAALGSCMATIMGILAERRGWDLGGLRIEVSKEMSKDLPRRIARLSTEIWVPLKHSQDSQDSLRKAALTCPVHASLHPAIEKPIVFHWQPE